jgi:hypothetical protein
MSPDYLTRKRERLEQLIADAEDRLARMARVKHRFDRHAWGSEFGTTVRALEAHLGELRQMHAEALRALASAGEALVEWPAASPPYRPERTS